MREPEEYTVTVRDLIAKLQAMPQDAKVITIYDGFCSVPPAHVWLSQGGFVVMVDYGDVVYHDEDRPPGAPTVKEEYSWHAPEAPSIP